MNLYLRRSVHLSVMLLSICIASCTAGKFPFARAYKAMNTAEKAITDSILLHALDHEALYTLCDTLKPMSSVKFYHLPMFSTNKQQQDSAITALQNLQLLVNKLALKGDVQFILNPFERADSIYKNVELYVIRKSRLQSIINTHQNFYSRLGITSHTLAETILAITEYENKYDRWRSYGYLFGYPDYAVDFFVNAGKSQDSTKEFVKRDFFQIPVYAATSGHFTYAMPKGHQPVAADSLIYKRAVVTLNAYKYLRQKNITPTKMNTITLLKKLNKKYNHVNSK